MTWRELAAVPLRLVLGLVLLVRGVQKLGLLGGPGLEAAAEVATSAGLAPGLFWAAAAAALEIVGGLFLLGGLLTRWAALVLAVERLVALFLVHLRMGFDAARGGVEYPVVLVGALVALALLGPGPWALDRALPEWVPSWLRDGRAREVPASA